MKSLHKVLPEQGRVTEVHLNDKVMTDVLSKFTDELFNMMKAKMDPKQ